MKTHLEKSKWEDSPFVGIIDVWSWCGIGGNRTTDLSLVDCKSCLKLVKTKSPVAQMAEASNSQKLDYS
jgi:hypothetical protein